MGLAGKIVCGVLIAGAFVAGRITYSTDLNAVYRFIDKDTQNAEQVFTYSWDKLQVADPAFLDRYGQNLSEVQKKQIAQDYIKQKLDQAYNEGKKSVDKISRDLSDLFSGN